MQQTFPPGRVNHVIFLTDGLPTVGEIELRALSALVDQGFLSALAEEHQGEAYFLSEEGDIEAALRELFAAFTFPLLRLDELSFDPVEIHDVHPRGVETLAAGRELFQVGRYRGGGAFTLRVSGHLGEERVVLDYPLECSRRLRSRPR